MREPWVVDGDVLAVSVVFVELDAVRFDVSPDALGRALAVGIVEVVTLFASWLAEAVALVPDKSLIGGESVLKPEKLVEHCEGVLFIDCVRPPQRESIVIEAEVCATVHIKPVLAEDEGCAAGPKTEPAVAVNSGCVATTEFTLN